MAVILSNEKIHGSIYLMRVEDKTAKSCKTGQFYMIRPTRESDPMLPRPISIFNADDSTVEFVYDVVGRGTRLMSEYRAGDEINLFGPLGNGFELIDSDITMIGGGVGVAPLYYLAKEHKRLYPNRKRNIYLGYREGDMLRSEFEGVCDEVVIKIGGYITDDVNFEIPNVYYICGPTPMMEAAMRKLVPFGHRAYVSLEKHMACGVGACLVCTCGTKDGHKRVCKDGPVFSGYDIFDAEGGRFI